MTDRNFRNKITWMMFLLSMFVIWIHAVNLPDFYDGSQSAAWEYVNRLEGLFSELLGQIAVPGFFMMSSYLFFRTYSPETLFIKWKSRVFSVVIPYVVWNTLYYLGYVLATRLPGISVIVGKEAVPFSIFHWVDAVVWYQYAPIFWYLFQLILLFALSPLIYVLIKRRTVGLIYIGILCVLVHLRVVGRYPNLDALIYYSAAGFLAVHGKKWVERFELRRNVLWGLLFLAISVVCAYETYIAESYELLWIVGYRFFAFLTIWVLIPEKKLMKAKPWMKQSLFIYAIHFPVVRLINKGTARGLLSLGVQTEILCAVSVGLFLVIPAVVVLFSYMAARLLSKWTPVVWRILAGGRELE